MSGELFIAAFVTGTVFTALAGNYVESCAREPARMGVPFLNVDYPVMSLLRLLIAGPYFLVSEVIAAHRVQAVGLSMLVTAFTFAALWCLASGIICLEGMWQLSQLVSAKIR